MHWSEDNRELERTETSRQTTAANSLDRASRWARNTRPVASLAGFLTSPRVEIEGSKRGEIGCGPRGGWLLKRRWRREELRRRLQTTVRRTRHDHSVGSSRKRPGGGGAGRDRECSSVCLGRRVVSRVGRGTCGHMNTQYTSVPVRSWKNTDF